MEKNSRVDGAISLGRGKRSANQSSCPSNTYLLYGVFKLPRGLCQHINLLIRKFWWGNTTNGRRKTNWVAWKKLIQPKFMGGLGFRDIELFNLALLARQAWRILQNPLTMTARLLKAVYYPACDFLQAPLGSRPSQVWRALIEGRDVLK